MTIPFKWKLKLSILKSKLAHLFRRISYWLDEDFIQSCCFTDKITIDINRFIPDDKNWHHFSMNLSYWYKKNEDAIKKEDILVDGLYVSNVLSEVKK